MLTDMTMGRKKEALYKYVKERCNLTDEEFQQYNDDIGMDPVVLGAEHAPKIDPKHVAAIAAMLEVFMVVFPC